MKLVLDPEGSAIDLAKKPLSVEDIKVTPGKKKVDFVSTARTDGAVPFGTAATDVMMIEISLRVDEQATLDEGLAELRKVSQLLDEIENQLPAGLPLEETPDNSETPSTAYVLLGEITEIPREMSGDQLGWYHKAPFAVITLTCEPFYEGPEEEAGEVEGEDIVELEIPEVKGDVEAPALAVVTAGGGESIRHYELGRESRYYDSAEPAPMLIEGDEFDTAGFAGEEIAAPAWAESAKVVKATLVSQPVAVCSTGSQEHIGQWRANLRFYASSTDVYVRLAYRVGDGPWGRSAWVRTPVAEAAVVQFLDLFNIPEAVLGGQRWEGWIEAYSSAEADSDTLEIDRLENIPAENWLQLSAPYSPLQAPVLYDVFDDFKQSAGNATGKKAELGGVYAALENSDGTDFTIDDEVGKLTRTATLDTGTILETLAGRAIGTPTKFTDVVMGHSFDISAANGAGIVGTATGQILSYVNNAAFAFVFLGFPLGGEEPEVHQAVAYALVPGLGEFLQLKKVPGMTGRLEFSGKLISVISGNELSVYVESPELGLQFLFTVEHAMIGAEGKAALYDHNVGEGPCTREYDNLRIWTPPPVNFVCADGQDLRIDHELAERYDSTGTYLAPVPENRGRGFTLAPSGDRGRKVRLIGKARVNDVGSEGDAVEGSKHRLRVTYKPRYRFPANA